MYLVAALAAADGSCNRTFKIAMGSRCFRDGGAAGRARGAPTSARWAHGFFGLIQFET